MNYRERLKRIEARIGFRIDEAALAVTLGEMLQRTIGGEGGPFGGLPDGAWAAAAEGRVDVRTAIKRLDAGIEERRNRRKGR